MHVDRSESSATVEVEFEPWPSMEGLLSAHRARLAKTAVDDANLPPTGRGNLTLLALAPGRLRSAADVAAAQAARAAAAAEVRALRLADARKAYVTGLVQRPERAAPAAPQPLLSAVFV